MKKYVMLRPVKLVKDDFDIAEKRMLKVFLDEIYRPIIKLLKVSPKTIENAVSPAMLRALQAGLITFSNGTFYGKFNASIVRELKELGAKWDKKTSTFKIHMDKLPYDLRMAISASAFRFEERIHKIDKLLSQVLPEKLADKVKVADVFDSSIFKTNRELESTLKSVTVVPELSPDRRRRIADEWETNMRLYIKNFTEEQIVKLRQAVQASAFSGSRYSNLVEAIQKSYGVTEGKAKFLARQETSLLMTKLKEVRYTEANVNHYKWTCVAGSANHPVRLSHKILDGKIFSWNDPPITTAPDEPQRRNNPGQDYNCRCYAIPVLKKA